MKAFTLSTRKPSVLRKNLHFLTKESLVAIPSVYLCLPGNIIVAAMLTQVFGLSDTAYGVITSLPAWSNVLQIFLLPLLARRFSSKQISLSFAWAQVALWLGLAWILPYLPVDNSRVTSGVFFWVFLAISFSQSAIAVGWTAWIQEWMPGEVRGRFFGIRNRFLQLTMVSYIFLSGYVLEFFRLRSPVEGYQLLIGLFALLRVFSIFFQERIIPPAHSMVKIEKADWLEQLAVVRKSDGFFAFTLAGAAWGFTSGFFGPFFNRYILESLNFSIKNLSYLVMIATVCSAISTPAWGRLIDHFGCRPVMVFSLIVWVTLGYLWCFFTPENAWMLYPMWALGGLVSAGFMQGMFNMLLKLVPEEAKTTAISLNLAVTAAFTAIAPILGGTLLDLAWASGIERLRGYHIMCFIHNTMILLVVPWALLRVREPKSKPVVQLLGAMRSYREISAMLGLSFLGNFVAPFRKRN